MSISVQKITKTFGTHTALAGVSLEVPDGELVALLGPSGSGKTTLLRIIAGLEAPDPRPGSAILFHGQDMADQHVGQRQVGFVFQHYALFRHMTVFENIAFGLRVRPRKLRSSRAEIQARVRELLRLIQLEGIEHRLPSQLSGGQRQRVALARALAVQPRVLLLDEPFGALDAQVRQDLRRWLRRLHDEIHVTSVFVTHDQDEALEVADRVAVMNHGRIEQVGTPDEVFHHPANEFVMNFLGQVNLFHGRIESGKAVFDQTGSPQADNGDSSKLFVRPYELDIIRSPNGASAIAARVERIQSAGPVVKVELKSRTGESINVEMAHDRFRAIQVSNGDEVYVVPRDVKIFFSEGEGI